MYIHVKVRLAFPGKYMGDQEAPLFKISSWERTHRCLCWMRKERLCNTKSRCPSPCVSMHRFPHPHLPVLCVCILLIIVPLSLHGYAKFSLWCNELLVCLCILLTLKRCLSEFHVQSVKINVGPSLLSTPTNYQMPISMQCCW